jgi:hypothetical protein
MVDLISDPSTSTSKIGQLCGSAVDTRIFEHIFGPLEFEGSGGAVFPDAPDPNESSSNSTATSFPLPSPITSAAAALANSPETLASVYRALLRGTADSLPRLQEALFASTLGKPVVNVLSATRSLKIAQAARAWYNVAWSERALAEQTMDYLRCKVPGATAPTTAIRAHNIVIIINDLWESTVPQFHRTPTSIKHSPGCHKR